MEKKKNQNSNFPVILNFEIYLNDIKNVSPGTIKNYRADLRHFFSWLKPKKLQQRKQRLFFFKKSKNKQAKDEIVSQITPQLLSEYKNFLLANKSAKSTVNRKLATLRTFCQFCYNTGLLEQSPAQNLTNLSVKRSKEKEIHDLVSKFGAWLKQKRASRNTIKNYTADIRQYLLSQ